LFVEVDISDHHAAEFDVVHVCVFVFIGLLELLLGVVETVDGAHLIVVLVEVDGARTVFVDLPEEFAQFDQRAPLDDTVLIHVDGLVELVDPLEDGVFARDRAHLGFLAELNSDD